MRARATKDEARSAALIPIEIETGIMNIEIRECGHEVTEAKHMVTIWETAIFIITANTIMKVIGTRGTIGRDTGKGMRSDSVMEDTIVRKDGSFSNIVTPPTACVFSFPLEDRTRDLGLIVCQ